MSGMDKQTPKLWAKISKAAVGAVRTRRKSDKEIYAVSTPHGIASGSGCPPEPYTRNALEYYRYCMSTELSVNDRQVVIGVPLAEESTAAVAARNNDMTASESRPQLKTTAFSGSL